MNSITYAEQALLDLHPALPALPADAVTLITGNRSGCLPVALATAKMPFVAHAFDIHHAHAIHDALVEAGFSGESVRTTPYVIGDKPLGDGDRPYSRAFFQTTPRSMSAELVLDQLEDIYRALDNNCSLFAAFEGDADDALRTVKKVFPSVHVLHRDKKVAVFRAVRTGPKASYRDFSATWPASVPGGQTLNFTSLPGCFCHRRADPGGLALAEVAARELVSGSVPTMGSVPLLRILDMGCGCGLVGLLVADALRRAGRTCTLTLIDSHARALAAARINAERFGFADVTRLVLSDDGVPRNEVATHDVFLGNPPYYSDYRIADIFLSTAYRALVKNGVCYSVVKTASGLKPVQEKYFATAETIPRRGYAVLRSIRT